MAFLQVPVYHDIQIDMEERMSPDVIRGIREGVASPDICWDAADLGGLQSRSYRTDHLAIVVHPSHPLQNRALPAPGIKGLQAFFAMSAAKKKTSTQPAATPERPL